MTAQASVWTGGSGNWSSNGDPGWNGTGVPNAVGAVASFTTSGTASLDLNVTIGTYSYSAGSNSTRSIGLGSNVLTFDQDGAGAGYATFSNTATRAGDRLSIGSGSVVLADDLLLTNTGACTGSYSIGISSTISGAGNLTIYNVSNSVTAGPVSLSGTNTFTGSVLLQKGSLILSNAASLSYGALGSFSNVVTLGSAGNGSVTAVWTGTLATQGNSYVIASGTGGTTLFGSTSTGASDTNFTGTFTMNGDLSVTSAKPSGNLVQFSNVLSGVGALTKVGTGVVVLSAANTYTGNTTVSEGTLNLASTGELRFKIQNANASNQLLGGSTVNLDGLFRLDVSALTDTTGTWNLVNVGTLTETFGGTFNLAFVGGPTFTDQGGGVFTSGNWTFTTSDGNLTLIPEPATMALLALGGVGVLIRRRR